jgi:hypothetical protein
MIFPPPTKFLGLFQYRKAANFFFVPVLFIVKPQFFPQIANPQIFGGPGRQSQNLKFV